MKNIISWGRQGDFYLESIDISLLPELEKTPITSMEKYIEPSALILGLGERTGHKHQIENIEKKSTMFKAANLDRFFVIVDDDGQHGDAKLQNHEIHGLVPLPHAKDAKVKHEEHGAIPMPHDVVSTKKRAYEVVRQREDRRGKSVQVAD